jgi:hypothetical protein
LFVILFSLPALLNRSHADRYSFSCSAIMKIYALFTLHEVRLSSSNRLLSSFTRCLFSAQPFENLTASCFSLSSLALSLIIDRSTFLTSPSLRPDGEPEPESPIQRRQPKRLKTKTPPMPPPRATIAKRRTSSSVDSEGEQRTHRTVSGRSLGLPLLFLFFLQPFASHQLLRRLSSPQHAPYIYAIRRNHTQVTPHGHP